MIKKTIVFALLILFLTAAASKKETAEMVIPEVDFTKIEDGRYVGEYYYKDFFKKYGCKLLVIVYSQKIADIVILENTLPEVKKELEMVLWRILYSQKMDVNLDTRNIVGSKVYIKAVQLALTEGKRLKSFKLGQKDREVLE